MTTETVLDICRQTVENLEALLGERLVAVALYGSYARGDADERSDIDLLILAQELPQHPVKRSALVRKGMGYVQPLPPTRNFIAYTPEEFGRIFPSLFLDIGLDAKILYDAQGLLNKRLQRIREVTEEAGLFRIRDGNCFIWKWKKPPKRGWIVDWEGYREF